MNLGCKGCYFEDVCGGVDGNLDLFGCHHHTPAVCKKFGWTCPWCRPREFRHRWNEVGGWPPKPPADLLVMDASLPAYIPKIDHWSSRAGVLDVPIVALPMDKLLRGKDDECKPRFRSRVGFHRTWKISRRTRSLLVAVAADAYLEKFWAYHREKDLLACLAELGALGATVHNFSYFSDAPRTHTLYNQTRMARVIERMSAAGIPVVPHLNALTRSDWDHWRRVLEDFPDVRFVCKEFQTHDGKADLDGLARLQDDLGRPLHPIFVAGLRYAERIRELFDACTVIDGEPFHRMLHRRRARFTGSGIRWDKVDVPNGRELGALLAHNIQHYGEYATMRLTGRVPAQLDFMDIFERVAEARRDRRREPTLWMNFDNEEEASSKEKR